MRILVVDDDDTLRFSIVRDLQRQGFDVVSAGDAAEALGILADVPVDVLLTDLRMGDADGIDLIKSARLLSSHTRTLLMSGFATARDYQTAVDLGAVRVLCKPFTSADLAQAIRQAIECAVGFRGNVHGLALFDVLQMLHLARRTVTIGVDDGAGRRGVIHLRTGALVHAQLDDLAGEEALRALLGLHSGALSTATLGDDGPRTIEREFQAAVLDALRTLDEEHADRGDALDDWGLGEAVPEPVPPASDSSAIRWASRERDVVPAWRDAFSVGVRLSTAETLSLFDGRPLTGQLPAVTEMVAAADRMCGGTPWGALDLIGPSEALFLRWDRRRDLAIALGDVIRNPGEAALLRATAWSLARSVLALDPR